MDLMSFGSIQKHYTMKIQFSGTTQFNEVCCLLDSKLFLVVLKSEFQSVDTVIPQSMAVSLGVASCVSKTWQGDVNPQIKEVEHRFPKTFLKKI